MGRLQPSLKVVYYNFFYYRSILVVFCRAVTIPEPEGLNPPEKIFASLPLTKSGYFAFKIVTKKGQLLKIKPNGNQPTSRICCSVL